jgi:hypothetical protein
LQRGEERASEDKDTREQKAAVISGEVLST